jgi:hypothetical protein
LRQLIIGGPEARFAVDLLLGISFQKPELDSNNIPPRFINIELSKSPCVSLLNAVHFSSDSGTIKRPICGDSKLPGLIEVHNRDLVRTLNDNTSIRESVSIRGKAAIV